MSAGKGDDIIELHADHYMTPKTVNLALVQYECHTEK